LLLVCASCTGSVSGEDGVGGEGPPRGGDIGDNGGGGGTRPGGFGGGAGGSPSTPGNGGGVGPIAAGPESAGPRPLRRLTRLEYSNTIRDLLGDASRPGAAFPAEGPGSSGFGEPGKVSDVEARRFADAAEQVALAATKDLPKLMGCNPAQDEAGCVGKFLPAFGRRAFRRTLAPAEIAELKAFYDAARTRHDQAGAIGLLLQAMLQSPRFIYHWELGDGAAVKEGGLVKLGPYELASRLSYLLWRSMPDEALFAAAEGGKLKTADDVAAQAKRMLADAKARETLVDFHDQWALVDFTEVEKDGKTYPAWGIPLREAMVAEAQTFVDDVIRKGDGKLGSLLTGTASTASAPLAKLYGLGNVTGPTKLDPAQRAGLFTRAAFLASHGAEAGSHPIKRGKVIWERVVCGEIPPAPMNVPPPKPASPGLSTRERFAEHSQNACAAGCHALFDPPGFAFEHYDGIGAWRATDGGKPVDASGVLKLPIAGEKRFANAVEMMGVLAASEDVQRCVSTQWLRYALGRRDIGADGGSLARAHEAFRASGLDVRELVVALVKSKTFLYRQPAAGEVL
jgi:hypothetical protein